MSDASFVQNEPLPEVIESPPEKLASGFQFSEGPVWMPAGHLLFSDIPGNKIYKWSQEGGLEVWRDPSGNSNGLTLDRQGRLVICEQVNRRVMRLEQDGSITPLAEKWNGKRFNSPNDVVVRSDGMVFFSDPPYFVKDGIREIEVQAFYCVKPGGEPVQIASGYNKPNGLTFSPDESLLYVNDTAERIIDVFEVAADGTLKNKRRFATLTSDEKRGNPDGMKVDEAGNVYTTGPGAVWIYRPDGSLMGRLVLPELAANMAFGEEDRRSLFFTARSGLYRVRTRIPGIVAGR